ncbi:hypothetical protein BX600DRAFT_477880 [Xylariales sp. PMI_506]|nr:hypothetical protein BX600DRAFT_477880 [Xylariales sp. PMI_506]
MFRTTSYLTSDQDDECWITMRSIGAIFYIRWWPSDLASALDLLEDYLLLLQIMAKTKSGFAPFANTDGRG